MLRIDGLVFRYGGRVILNQADAHVAAGGRVGLVGRNGAGKSTLFKLILGELHTDGGNLHTRVRARVGCVAQEAPEGEQTLLDCVLAADLERTQLLAEAEACHDPHHLGEIHERLNAIDAHSAPSRAASILAGLGFDPEAQARSVSSFSGGWRMRVALAAALFSLPDLLLLDEPTNHLDLEATLWLQSFLASYPGTLIVISHDRELLNEVCNRILHLDNGKLEAYGGNYDAFVRVRREKIDLAAKARTKQVEERKRIQSFIDRFRAKATKAAQAQSRIKMLERMEPLTEVIEERSISFDFPQPEALSPPIVVVENATAGYGDTTVLRGLNLRIDMDDRIALLGANGNGKSTLAKILSGKLQPLTGETRSSSRLRIGYFAQHQSEELTADRTAYDHMAEVMRPAPEAKVRAQLGRFGFAQDRADVPAGNLSGGEKARLLFALMSRDAPHLIILDEPTNHLDIEARESLVSALNAYEGAVVLVSHDPHLIELTADRLWLVADGRVCDFDGDLNDYRKLLLDKAREGRKSGGGTGAGNSRKDERRAAAATRVQLAPLRRKVVEAEKTLEKLTAEKREIERKLADPILYQAGSGADQVVSLRRRAGELDKAIIETEEQWLLAQEEMEMAASTE